MDGVNIHICKEKIASKLAIDELDDWLKALPVESPVLRTFSDRKFNFENALDGPISYRIRGIRTTQKCLLVDPQQDVVLREKQARLLLDGVSEWAKHTNLIAPQIYLAIAMKYRVV
jgi:hypothetical protein